MWLIILCFGFVAFLIYYLENSRKVLKKCLFYVYFSSFHIAFVLVLLLWPYPVLNGRSIENGKIWAKFLKHATILFGLKWEIRNPEVLSKDRGAVIVANHQSLLDMIGIYNIWEAAGKLTVVARKELLYAGPMGLISYFGGIVFIDRKTPKSAYKQLEVTSNLIKKKVKVFVFPEGSRNYDYTKLLPFKKGAFTIAITQQAPIIPLVFSPYYFIDRKKFTFSKGRVIIRCLEEVPTTGLTMDDVPELIERVRNIILAAYKEISDEVIPSMSKKITEKTHIE